MASQGIPGAGTDPVPGSLAAGPFSRSRPLSENIEPKLAAAGVRLMPYPFDSAIAVASDIDGSSRETFHGYTRMLVHDLGLDFGDSVWLHWRYTFNREGVASLTNSVGFLTPSLTEQTAEDSRFFRRNPSFHELLSEYHEGTVDHFHALLPHGPRVAVLTDVVLDGGVLTAQIPPLDASCADMHLFGICFVFSGDDVPLREVRAQCSAGDTVAYGPATHDHPDDGNHYALFLCDPHSAASGAVPHLRNVERIVAETVDGRTAKPDRILLLGAFGPLLIEALERLRKTFHVELPLITEHARLHFRYPAATDSLRRSNARKFAAQSDTLLAFTGPLADESGAPIATMDSDEPHSFARVLPEIAREGELRFIVPKASARDSGFRVEELLAGSPSRSGGGFYWAERTMPQPGGVLREGAVFEGPPKHDTFVIRMQGAIEAATASPGTFWPIYTHIGSLARVDGRRIDLPEPYFEPGPLRLLQDRVFGITADVPPDGRIWFARASTLYDYALMVQAIPEHMERSGPDMIRLSSWEDPILGKRLPRTPGQLYGLTFYVDDEAAAGVTLDGNPIEQLTRNRPDATGRASVTIVECDIAATLFRALDPAVAAGAVLHGGKWAWRDGPAPYGRLVASSGQPASLRVPMHGTVLPGAQLLSMRVRADAECEFGLLIETATGGRFWFGTAALVGHTRDVSATYAVDRLRGNGEWLRLVVPFHDLDWSADAQCGGALPSHPIETITMIVSGPPAAAVDFGDVRLLRPKVSTQAHVPNAGHCVVGRVQGARGGESVRLRRMGASDASREAQTDQLGWFSFTAVAPGVYEVVGISQGDEYCAARGPAVEVWSDIARLELNQPVRQWGGPVTDRR